MKTQSPHEQMNLIKYICKMYDDVQETRPEVWLDLIHQFSNYKKIKPTPPSALNQIRAITAGIVPKKYRKKKINRDKFWWSEKSQRRIRIINRITYGIVACLYIVWFYFRYIVCY